MPSHSSIPKIGIGLRVIAATARPFAKLCRQLGEPEKALELLFLLLRHYVEA